MKSIDLIQPRHSYAPETREGHTYTNSSLRSIGARIQQAGVEVLLHDENIAPATITSDIVGMNLLGAPYIPVVREKIQQLRKQCGDDLIILLGWQVLTSNKGLTETQFTTLFGANVYNGMQPGVVESLLGVQKLPSEFQTSLIPIYEKLSDELFLKYCIHEISLFVSQWCAQACSFCAAAKEMPEKYRDIGIIYDDLLYIATRLSKLGKNTISIYMSNLDVFQTASSLSLFADMVQQVKNVIPWFSFTFRGLAGTGYFMKLHKNHPEIIRKLVSVWFNNVGYGVDGIGEAVRKWIKKPQNNEVNTLGAIQLSREAYGITPELLMVFGHIDIDNEDSLKSDLDFVEWMVSKYQAVPRPHISKPFIPGNDGWHDPKFAKKIELLIKHPELFQALDFTALANSITHDDENFRQLVNEYYLKMCQLPGNTTIPIQPYELYDTAEQREKKRQMNEGKFDR